MDRAGIPQHILFFLNVVDVGNTEQYFQAFHRQPVARLKIPFVERHLENMFLHRSAQADRYPADVLEREPGIKAFKTESQGSIEQMRRLVDHRSGIGRIFPHLFVDDPAGRSGIDREYLDLLPRIPRDIVDI